MAQLTWSQFKKRQQLNLRKFHENVIHGVGFQLAQEVKVHGKKVPAGECIKLIGLAYKSKRTVGGRITSAESLEGCKTEDYKCIYPQHYGYSHTKFINRFKNYYRYKSDSRFGSRIFVIADDRSVLPLGVLEKNEDFGGREVSMNSRSMKWGHLETLVQGTNVDLLKPGKSIEADWLDLFNEMMGKMREERRKSGEPMSFDLKVGSKVIPNCVGAMGAPGASSDPKADIVFLHYGTNNQLKITGFTSLKDGSTAKDFQQWGGLSSYKDDPEVQDFIETIKQRYPKGVPSGQGVGRDIKNRKLKVEAVYGPLYQTNRYNSDSCEFIIQGLPQGISSDGRLTTEGVIHTDSPSEMNKIFSGGTDPIFLARKGDRSDFKIPSTRVFILSKAGRAGYEEI